MALADGLLNLGALRGDQHGQQQQQHDQAPGPPWAERCLADFNGLERPETGLVESGEESGAGTAIAIAAEN